ncbi:jg20731 [Pararge aegeria aegeria]|uniref:Jg20731 protein n=1 Tax=Pararge aegeria aegeria TaxID=348720 RepID=A0A8S4RTG0_9NEOP|nr:jg20731 [Pararge aegeria aegeria]
MCKYSAIGLTPGVYDNKLKSQAELVTTALGTGTTLSNSNHHSAATKKPIPGRNDSERNLADDRAGEIKIQISQRVAFGGDGCVNFVPNYVYDTSRV